MPPVAGYHQGFRRPQIRRAIQEGATSVQEIAQRLGLSRQTTDAHLRRMRRDNEVTQHRPHGARRATWSLRSRG